MTPIIEQILQQGLAAHQSGDFALAQASYEHILCSSPRQPETNHALGLLMISTNQFSPAADCLKRALDAKPDDQSLWINYLDALISAKRFDEAAKIVEEARLWGLPSAELDVREFSILQARIEQNVASNKSSDEEYVELINVRPLATEDVQPAFGLCDPGATNAPFEQPIDVLISCYEGADLSDTEEMAAELNAQEFSILQPCSEQDIAFNKPDEGEHVGLITGQPLATEDALPAIVVSDLDATNVPSEQPIVALTDSYKELELSVAGDALADSIELITNQPMAPQPAADLLDAELTTGSLEQLVTALIRCYESSDFSHAEAIARQILEKFPNHFLAWSMISVITAADGRMTEALEASRELVSLSPSDGRAHYNLGNAYRLTHEFEKAEGSYREAIRLAPLNAEAHNNLGVVLQSMKRLTEAEACFSESLSLKPAYSEAKFNMGGVLLEMGRLREAKEWYRGITT